MSDEITISLPEGFTVRDDPGVGVSFYLDGVDYPFLQHTHDSNEIRKLLWQKWNKMFGIFEQETIT